MKEKPFHVLMVEDNDADAELVQNELSKAGFPFDCTRVDADDEFFKEVDTNPPDLVLCEHGGPCFNGIHMLKAVRRKHPEVPFILVTGGLGEEEMIKAFENGATDCVLKHRLSALVPAARKALCHAEQQ